MRKARNLGARRGASAIFLLFLMVVIAAMVAFAIDIGYMTVVRTNLQASADSSALAAVAAYIEHPDRARPTAKLYAEKYKAGSDLVDLRPNDDVQVGFWDTELRRFTPYPVGNDSGGNAVRVTTLISSERGNAAKLFFAPVLGRNEVDVRATATAMAMRIFRGFKPPASGRDQPILPFTIDMPSWNDVAVGIGPDFWSWDDELQEVVSGPDGVAEMNLVPEGNFASGNRGYLEIGSNGGANSALMRQIRHGLSPADFNFHGGALDLGEEGRLVLGGKPGMRASLASAFDSIVGELRIIPVFTEVTGNGNNTKYTLVQWVAVRVMHVNFRGNPKQVWIQPATIMVSGGIPSNEDKDSHGIYSPPRLVD